MQIVTHDLGLWCKASGRSLPLIFCIHVHSGPIYWGVIYLAKKIIRWWYFTCKKPGNIICDGILLVNMFHYLKIPYFTCKVFTKYTYNGYIGPYFFITRCSTIFALGGCTVLNLYESTWVHRRGIDLDLAVLRIHTIETFRTENHSCILTLHIYLKRNTYVYKGI
jgi:hypothetical protein